ncbi:chaplin family protein [Streptomyces sp. NPDC057654]|uniref:chaplin family protein n=1 Tax=Streptomyces sp. NPDC057654 TaxID=3346196 RepID=UPI0036A6A41F
MQAAGRRVGAVGAVIGAATGATLIPAGTAEANIIGIGNAAYGNSCLNVGRATAAGGTAASSGAASANRLVLPLHMSRNHCGNSGFICTALFRASV